MTITLIKETGALIANANTYVEVADVDAYWVTRGGNSIWEDLDSDEKRAKIVLAFDYIAGYPGFRWRGSKLSIAQRGPYPRSGASDRDGASYGTTDIPWQLKEAQSLLAPRVDQMVVMLPDLDRGGMVTSETLTGVYSASYAPDAPGYTVIQSVAGLLAPLLKGKDDDTPAAVVGEAFRLPDVYQSETYSPYTDDASSVDGTP